MCTPTKYTLQFSFNGELSQKELRTAVIMARVSTFPGMGVLQEATTVRSDILDDVVFLCYFCLPDVLPSGAVTGATLH